eukprot:355440-Rhodomonas_salina.1
MHSLPPKRGSAAAQTPSPSYSSAPPNSTPFTPTSGVSASPYQESTPMSLDGVDVPLTHETVEDIPWSSQVVVCREEQATTGVFGVGLRIDVNKSAKAFPVKNVSGLRDPTGRG